MDRETSLYLDLVRFLAALTVVASHIGARSIADGFLWQFGNLGNLAVLVFFVLSGYVVAYATDSRRPDGAGYAIARASRMFSVVVPALVLTVVLDRLGQQWNPGNYAKYDMSASTLALCLAFLNSAWTQLQPGSNYAYWSLGYEVPFYVFYGILIFQSGARRLALIAIAMLIYGPRVAALFPLWLLGVAAFRLSRQGMVGRRGGWMLFLGSLAAALSLIALTAGAGILLRRGIVQHTPLEIANDYLWAVLFAANIVGFTAISAACTWLQRWASATRWLAGATFSLYLFHVPILEFVSAAAPWDRNGWTYRLVLIGGTIGGCFLLAEFTERRKSVWTRFFAALLRTRPLIHPKA